MKAKYLIMIPFLSVALVGCGKTSDSNTSTADTSTTSDSQVIEDYYGLTSEDSMPLSNVYSTTNANAEQYMRFKVSHTMDYFLLGGNTIELSIFDINNNVLCTGIDECEISLLKGQEIYVKVKTSRANMDYSIELIPVEDMITLPYDLNNTVDTSSIEVNNPDTNHSPLQAATANFVKRANGTYVYCNNPETLGSKDIGQALQKNSGLKGEVYFTLEHSNFSSTNIYLGYQVKNEGTSPVYVTIKNVGYQTKGNGSWLGQQAWSDFYNTNFDIPDEYINKTSAYYDEFVNLYNFAEYEPRIYIPTTYMLPAGEAFYVMGGTTEDAYNNINIDNTANQEIPNGHCVNGNVIFNVSGGEVTGTLYCYNNVAQVAAEPNYQGYVINRDDTYYGGQYKGIGHHAGVIDASMIWYFNDKTSGNDLPVTYTSRYDDRASTVTEAFSKYNSTEHTLNYKEKWFTNFNPQADNTAVGTDMVAFECNLEDGTLITLDNDTVGANGRPGNFGNWMIEYQENYTFVNQGDNARKIVMYCRDNGSLAMLVRDKDGNVIDASYTFGRLKDYNEFSYEISVPAHSYYQVSLDYCLLANGNGGITHRISLFRV